MNELMKVKLNNNGYHTVSGRELHEYLEVRTPYHLWFYRMVKYGFLDGESFKKSHNQRNLPSCRRIRRQNRRITARHQGKTIH